MPTASTPAQYILILIDMVEGQGCDRQQLLASTSLAEVGIAGIGARIAEVEVQHHARVAGESKYGISRTFKVLVDLFTIQMLTWFRESPIRFFALMGLPFLAIASVSFIASLVRMLAGFTPVAIAHPCAKMFVPT